MRTLDVPAGELRLAAVEAAQAVTDLVLTGFRECTEVRLKRDSHDIVTEFDLLAERAIHSRLRDLVPGSGFVGEETGRHDEDRAIAWHVDPIDGTTNFASGMPAWSVSIRHSASTGLVVSTRSARMSAALSQYMPPGGVALAMSSSRRSTPICSTYCAMRVMVTWVALSPMFPELP